MTKMKGTNAMDIGTRNTEQRLLKIERFKRLGMDMCARIDMIVWYDDCLGK